MDRDSQLLAHFSDPDAVARYAEGPPRFVPGFADLHRKSAILLAARTPENARVLVLGAGGGLELKAFAQARPDWSFDGIDPAAEMLKLAERSLGPLAARVRLHPGYIDDAPEGPFDAGACLLTLHFLAPDERRRTAAEIRRRLKPGAPFVAAHSSFPQDPTRDCAGCRATPPLRSRPAPSLTRRRALARRSRPISNCSTRMTMKRSCVRPDSRMSACSTPPSHGAAGWLTLDVNRPQPP